ncbi:hypothetical protein [Natrinema versiforme]|uniref:DUF7964 domain-containing protein n=1 Tax=Natrinema versiforme TaxID=88724 RepID=A0A4P8WML9_9EURY|nr:hypothetical protein [Natrinema versiforme]QCS44674.1 hypothetical protein FEJ81_20445 [Natrinema versiforme]
MIGSIPHPLTPEIAEKIESSPKVLELHPEVMSQRMSMGSIIPAFFLMTENSACAVVENESQDGYRLLTKGEIEDEDMVYSALQEWCEQNGYQETH